MFYLLAAKWIVIFTLTKGCLSFNVVLSRQHVEQKDTVKFRCKAIPNNITTDMILWRGPGFHLIYAYHHKHTKYTGIGNEYLNRSLSIATNMSAGYQDISLHQVVDSDEGDYTCEFFYDNSGYAMSNSLSFVLVNKDQTCRRPQISFTVEKSVLYSSCSKNITHYFDIFTSGRNYSLMCYANGTTPLSEIEWTVKSILPPMSEPTSTISRTVVSKSTQGAGGLVNIHNYINLHITKPILLRVTCSLKEPHTEPSCRKACVVVGFRNTKATGKAEDKIWIGLGCGIAVLVVIVITIVATVLNKRRVAKNGKAVTKCDKTKPVTTTDIHNEMEMTEPLNDKVITEGDTNTADSEDDAGYETIHPGDGKKFWNNTNDIL